MMGMRWRIATSCARSILVMVSGHQDPALTVASLATITTSPAATTPAPRATSRRAPLLDELDDLRGGRAGPEQLGHAPALQALDVVLRDDAAANQEDVPPARLVQPG